MTEPEVEEITLEKCTTCHARFAPRPGPCPRCMSGATETFRVPGLATVLASTALEVPPPDWAAPHLLAVIELEDAVRLLALPDAPLPSPGDRVAVRLDGSVYRTRPIPVAGG